MVHVLAQQAVRACEYLVGLAEELYLLVRMDHAILFIRRSDQLGLLRLQEVQEGEIPTKIVDIHTVEELIVKRTLDAPVLDKGLRAVLAQRVPTSEAQG